MQSSIIADTVGKKLVLTCGHFSLNVYAMAWRICSAWKHTPFLVFLPSRPSQFVSSFLPHSSISWQL